MRARVTVRVPGSTSNLGAGFDCVGVAVDRWLRVTATTGGGSGANTTLERHGTLGALDIPADADLLTRGFAAACARAGRAVPAGLSLVADSEAPVARGLGSSAAATVAGAAAAPHSRLRRGHGRGANGRRLRRDPVRIGTDRGRRDSGGPRRRGERRDGPRLARPRCGRARLRERSPRGRLRDGLKPAPMAPRSRPPHIHKFGGASLADAAGVRRAVEIVLTHRPGPQVVVVSAMGGVTDALLEAARRATRGETSQVRAAAETLRAQHTRAA